MEAHTRELEQCGNVTRLFLFVRRGTTVLTTFGHVGLTKYYIRMGVLFMQHYGAKQNIAAAKVYAVNRCVCVCV